MSRPIRLLWMLVPMLPAAAGAQPATPAPAPGSCIEVQVNGERVPAYDCLQRKLTPTATPAPAKLPPGDTLMRTPGNALLQYNHEGTRQRMGSAFGQSVVPQRPAR